MTDIPDNLENPGSISDKSKGNQRRSRRKRSLIRTAKRRLDRFLRTRQLMRTGIVLLPLAGFLYITINNVSPRPSGQSTASIPSRDKATDSSLQTMPSTQQASAWTSADPESSRPLAKESGIYHASNEPVLPETDETGDGSVKTSVYIVNEGGSLWRTGRQFINDEVVLDRLIDSLSDSGMDVRRVRAGIAFIVNDLNEKGLLVVVDDGDKTYESHIMDNTVTTTVRRQIEKAADSSRTALLEQ